MTIKGFKRNFKSLEVLTESQLNAIHRGTLRVLSETGVTFSNEKALKILAQNGCRVDFDNKRVRIPEWLVMDCLGKCPSTFSVKARDPKDDLILGGNTSYFLSNGALNIVDLKTWEPFLDKLVMIFTKYIKNENL